MRITIASTALAVAVVSVSIPSAHARDLTIEERVQARAAVERVYWSHRTWPVENAAAKPPLSRTIPDAEIRARVEDTLRKCEALRTVWHRPITTTQLQAEIDRMARGTKDPAMLRELFDALDDDPVLIAETLARPVLADRLIRNYHAGWTDLEPRTEPSPDGLVLPRIPASACTDDTWSQTAIDVPDPRTLFAAVWTGAEMIVWGGYTHPQNLFHTGGRYDPATDTWTAIPVANAPSARQLATAVWTGTEMIVWGGTDGAGAVVNTGGRYNPSTNTWTPTSIGTGVPAARWKHTAVWTGTEMIVWGGAGGSGTTTLNTGSRYNPVTDTWTATTTSGAPAKRDSHTAVWTGSVMIVWGGSGLNTGARYNPATNSWASTSTGANVPTGRTDHRAVWTGTEMIVIGGSLTGGGNPGGRYNPTTNTWSTISTVGFSATRTRHTAVWTGSAMIVWGGTPLGAGERYDPLTDTWTPTSTGPGMPISRLDTRAVWTGTEMIVWGGTDGNNGLNSGGRYDPSSDTWVPTPVESGMPSAREFPATVWTGAEFLVWGGVINTTPTARYPDTGGRYDPATDTWTPTSTGANVPVGRSGPTAVWTGSRMIVWGGYNSGYLQSGAQYDPATDTWTTTSIGASTPEGRYGHGAVWTGTEMIVWGGEAGSGFPSTGGRYDPSTDTWTPTSTGANVPAGRFYLGMVWTGARMVVWGGQGSGAPLNTGGRYDPVTDTWTPTSTGANVPTARLGHSAVWTGTQMIVWGGANGPAVATGGRYDPVSDAWTSMTATGAPSARQIPSAVWTGKEMVVFGGADDVPDPVGAGGRYDPATNTWLPMSSSGSAPSERWGAASGWTGTQMFVWGGHPDTATGGIYCACSNGALLFRDADGDGYGNSGVTLPSCDGSIAPGYVADGTDCDDHSASAHPGGVEVCDGLDNDCSGAADDGIAPPSGTLTVAVAKSGTNATLTWAPLFGATSYDAVEGGLALLASSAGDFQAATTACIANDTTSTSTTSMTPLSPGSGVWIVVRGGNCGGAGSYDEGGASQLGSRDAEIASSGSACP